MLTADFDKYREAILAKVDFPASHGIAYGLLWTAIVMERPDIARDLLTRYGERAAQGIDPHGVSLTEPECKPCDK